MARKTHEEEKNRHDTTRHTHENINWGITRANNNAKLWIWKITSVYLKKQKTTLSIIHAIQTGGYFKGFSNFNCSLRHP